MDWDLGLLKYSSLPSTFYKRKSKSHSSEKREWCVWTNESFKITRVLYLVPLHAAARAVRLRPSLMPNILMRFKGVAFTPKPQPTAEYGRARFFFAWLIAAHPRVQPQSARPRVLAVSTAHPRAAATARVRPIRHDDGPSTAAPAAARGHAAGSARGGAAAKRSCSTVHRTRRAAW